jgi:hypothetical protein
MCLFEGDDCHLRKLLLGFYVIGQFVNRRNPRCSVGNIALNIPSWACWKGGGALWRACPLWLRPIGTEVKRTCAAYLS